MTYTQATGKRPYYCEYTEGYGWFVCDGDVDVLPSEVFARLAGGEVKSDHVGSWVEYPTESDALTAADDAYLRAVADGVMEPIEGVA